MKNVFDLLWLYFQFLWFLVHYNDVTMREMASQITSLTIVYSTVYSRRRSKKTSKLRVTGLCAGNSPVTGEFPAQRASNAENFRIWRRYHVNAFPISLRVASWISGQLYNCPKAREVTLVGVGELTGDKSNQHKTEIVEYILRCTL